MKLSIFTVNFEIEKNKLCSKLLAVIQFCIPFLHILHIYVNLMPELFLTNVAS